MNSLRFVSVLGTVTRWPLFPRRVASVAVILALLSSTPPGWTANPLTAEAVLDTGEAIFTHRWRPGVPGSQGGDGLGPVHNDVSCVACHSQGGVGGGGGIEKNATMLSLAKKPIGMSKRVFVETAASIHPALLEQSGDLKPSLVLHKFSTDPEYNATRRRFVGLEMPIDVEDEQRESAERKVADRPVRSITHKSGVRMLLSQRNSPALFGLGMIDRIPDAVLHRLAATQARKKQVSGRVSPVNGRAGKFGWKAQTATLQEFVRDACANELGLQVPGADQAPHPLHLDYKPEGFDLSAGQLATLTAFVSSLSAPNSCTPADDGAAKVARRGKHVFQIAGCAECHVETLGDSASGIQEIYSDLLLHDMGPKLADPVLANPLTRKVKIQVPGSTVVRASDLRSSVPASSRSSGGGSYGGGATRTSPGMITSRGSGTKTITIARVVPTNRSQEWRTPPLWGVSASAPYLHDGRASTLTEAILYHGGEAKFSVKRFLAMPPSDRIALVEFLHTLVPPGVEEI